MRVDDPIIAVGRNLNRNVRDSDGDGVGISSGWVFPSASVFMTEIRRLVPSSKISLTTTVAPTIGIAFLAEVVCTISLP